jgi:hypothetical protein
MMLAIRNPVIPRGLGSFRAFLGSGCVHASL